MLMFLNSEKLRWIVLLIFSVACCIKKLEFLFLHTYDTAAIIRYENS